MEMMKCSLLVLFSCLLCISCVSETKYNDHCDDNYTNLCATDETEYRIDSYFIDQQNQILRTFHDQPDNSNIYGEYTSPAALTSGQSFCFFPDNSLAIVEWNDLSLQRTVAIGTWTVQSDIISITNLNPENALQRYERYLGRDGNLKIFVVKNGNLTGDTILVPVQNLAKDKFKSWDYLRRNEYYIDWQKLKKEQLEQKKEQPERRIFKMPPKPEPMTQAE